MVDPAAPPAGTTVLTAPIPATPDPAAQLFPGTPSGTPPTPPPAPVTPPPATPPATPPAPPAPVTPPAAPPSEPPKPPEAPKPPEGTQPPAPAPKDYALSLPEGSPLTTEELATTLKDAKDAGLSEEQAKQMLTSKDQTARAAQTRLQEQQTKAFEATKAQWKETIAKDPEMGGDKHSETTILSARAFQTLASPELRIWAEKTGLGSYPEFVRLMAKVGRLIGEDKLIRGNVNEPEAPRPPEERLYGKTTPGANGQKPAA